jgi:hypothetical protein
MKPIHLAAPVIALAVIYGSLVAESIVVNATWLQLRQLDPWTIAIGVTTGISVAIQLFWLLAIGVWFDGSLARIGGVILNASISIFGSAIIAFIAGFVMSIPLRGAYLTLNSPQQNLIQDQFLYALLLLFGGALPIIAVAKRQAITSSDYVLYAIVLALNIPALLTIGLNFFWVTSNNQKHLRSEMRRHIPRQVLAQAMLQSASPREIQRKRIERLACHIRGQIWLSSLVLLIGLVWIVAFHIR